MGCWSTSPTEFVITSTHWKNLGVKLGLFILIFWSDYYFFLKKRTAGQSSCMSWVICDVFIIEQVHLWYVLRLDEVLQERIKKSWALDVVSHPPIWTIISFHSLLSFIPFVLGYKLQKVECKFVHEPTNQHTSQLWSSSLEFELNYCNSYLPIYTISWGFCLINCLGFSNCSSSS